MIIFKGKPDEQIARRKLPTLDPTSIYACQDAAWMDERCMLIWVDELFSAYLVANPPPEGVQPILLLDSYRCRVKDQGNGCACHSHRWWLHGLDPAA